MSMRCKFHVVVVGTGILLFADTWAAAQRTAAILPEPANRPAVRGQNVPESPPGAQQPGASNTRAGARQKGDPTAVFNPRGAGANGPAKPPTVVGQVATYEVDKSITIETKRRGGELQKREFSLVGDKSRIELLGDLKAITVGTMVSVWADEDNPTLAARIVAGDASRTMPRNRRSNNQPPAMVAWAEPVVPRPVVPKKPLRPPVAGLSPLDVARQIDQHVEARLAAENVEASPPCDDAEFIRRVYLDIIGVIPPATEVASLLDSPDPQKRARLIDRLLASPEYGRHFGDVWCERIVSRDLKVAKQPFIDWLADNLNEGRGWDEIVYDMLTADGSFKVAGRGLRAASEDPQAFFVLVNTEGSNSLPAETRPQWLAAEGARLFLGVQLQCAECHDHPFTTQWKQTDFWGLAAFFSQLRIERTPQYRWTETPPSDKPVEIAISTAALKSIGKTVRVRLLGDDKDFQPGKQQLLRRSLAHWMTSPDNSLFAQAAMNRLWAHFFGRGLVDPVDDLRADNPPSHPAILKLLAEEFKKSQFDQKHLIRCLCLSQAYQRTSQPLPESEQGDEDYSRMAVRLMRPGVFYDSLKAATGWPELKLDLPARIIIQDITPRELFVDFYLSSQGEAPDPTEYRHGIPQALKLLNAPLLNRVAPTVERLARSVQGRQQVIEQLYLISLARRPTAAETSLTADFLDRRKDANPEEAYSAVLWVLLNSSEFVSNH